MLEAARPKLEGPLTLVLERELVVAVHCPRCDWRVQIMRPRTKVSMAQAVCPNCREIGRPEFVSAVEETSPLASRSLAAVGLPAYDIVRVDGGSSSGFFLLAGDRTGRAGGWGLSR